MKLNINEIQLVENILCKRINFRILYTNQTKNARIISVDNVVAFTKQVGRENDGIFLVEKIRNANYITGVYILQENITKLYSAQEIANIFTDGNDYTSLWKVTGIMLPQPMPYRESVGKTEDYPELLLNTINRTIKPETIMNILKEIYIR